MYVLHTKSIKEWKIGLLIKDNQKFFRDPIHSRLPISFLILISIWKKITFSSFVSLNCFPLFEQSKCVSTVYLACLVGSVFPNLLEGQMLKRPGLNSSVLHLSVLLKGPKGGVKYVLKKFLQKSQKRYRSYKCFVY